MLRLVGAVAVAIAASFGLGSASVASARVPGENPECAKHPESWNTMVCGMPAQVATDDCASTAAHSLGRLKIASIDGDPSSNNRVQFHEDGMTGCNPAGVRKVSFYLGLMTEGSDSYTKVSRTLTSVTNKERKVSRALQVNQSIDCTDPAMAGATIAGVVTVKYTPKKGWGKVPKNDRFGEPIHWDHYTKKLRVC